MNYDEAEVAKALQLAQKATEFDHSRRYDEAIYFYVEAAQRILELHHQKKILPVLRSKALGYVDRAEFLKKDLNRLQKNAEAAKPQHRIAYEKAEFAFLKAEHLYGKERFGESRSFFEAACEGFLALAQNCPDQYLLKEAHVLATRALDRTQELQEKHDSEADHLSVENLISQLPQVPSAELPLPPAPSDLDDQFTSPSADERSPSQSLQKLPSTEGLSKDELAVLATTSNINGRQYVPFLSHDLREKFTFLTPYVDSDGKVTLADKQKKRLKTWMRPSEFSSQPVLINNIDSGTIKQTVIADCSFVSSLAIAARYERRFGKQLVTSIIYPQNRKGVPVYNPSGKYMIKFYINGIRRKVIIDDFFPVDERNDLLCSQSQNKDELWVSLLEKAYMKVMGGYDFPGSNSNIDLHALTGWIPERIAFKDMTEKEKVFDKLLSRFHRGDCLITLATGKLDKELCDRAGLVDAHAYAVLDLRMIDGKRLLMVKNPWTHLRWKGRYSENDLTNWTQDLQRRLDYDPKKAKERDDGVFWIDYESVCNFFEVFYVNWNPEIFPFTYGLHSSWSHCAGPVKDLYSIAENPQYVLEVRNKSPAAVWILLTRHITDISDFAENKEYITVMVYKSGKKVYLPFDPKPLYEGTRINSPHYLCQMLVTDTGVQKYTLVVAQYEKTTTIYYTLRVYASCEFSLRPLLSPYVHKKKESGKWEGKSAGGCGNGSSRETYQNNPLYHVSLEERSDENTILIELRGPRQYSVGFEVRQVSSNRNIAFERKDSGVYRPGYTMLQLEKVPAGLYSIRPMTFQAGQEGPFFLHVEASCGFTLKKFS